eukprot:PhM_4_TR1221/c0_g1_i1/m.24351
MRRLSFFEAQGFGVPEYDAVCAEQATDKWATIQEHERLRDAELRVIRDDIRQHTTERNNLQRKIGRVEEIAPEDLATLDAHEKELERLEVELSALSDHWERHFELPQFKLTPMDRRVLYGQRAFEKKRTEEVASLAGTLNASILSSTNNTSKIPLLPPDPSRDKANLPPLRYVTTPDDIAELMATNSPGRTSTSGAGVDQRSATPGSPTPSVASDFVADMWRLRREHDRAKKQGFRDAGVPGTSKQFRAATSMSMSTTANKSGNFTQQRKPPHRLPPQTPVPSSPRDRLSVYRTSEEQVAHVLDCNRRGLEAMARNEYKLSRECLRAALRELESDGSDFGEQRGELLEVTHNNLACLAQKARRPQSALRHLEAVMLSKGEEAEDAAVLLNLCAVLAQGGKHMDAVLAARRAVMLLQRRLHDVLTEANEISAMTSVPHLEETTKWSAELSMAPSMTVSPRDLEETPSTMMQRLQRERESTLAALESDPSREQYVTALYNLGMCQLQLKVKHEERMMKNVAPKPQQTTTRRKPRRHTDDTTSHDQQVTRTEMSSFLSSSEGQHALGTLQLAHDMAKNLLGADHALTAKCRLAVRDAERTAACLEDKMRRLVEGEKGVGRGRVGNSYNSINNDTRNDPARTVMLTGFHTDHKRARPSATASRMKTRHLYGM